MEKTKQALGGGRTAKVPAAPGSISREMAEKSVDEWMPYVRESLIQAIMDPKQHRDIGKVLAQAAEVYVNTQLCEMSGRKIAPIVGEPYDNRTCDDGPDVRGQVKFRMGDWHFETTRRNSKKNAETNGTGHVAYRKEEFDMVSIFVPGPNFGLTGSRVRCIPTEALVDPERPHQLVTRIKKDLQREYDCAEKTAEIIQKMYGKSTPPRG